MKNLTLLASMLVVVPSLTMGGELQDLRSANAEQKRQITQLEGQIDELYGLLEKANRNGYAALPAKATQVKSFKSSGSYVVVAGDSLSKIARVHNVPLGSLMTQNNLGSKSVLQIGQKLSIPSNTIVAKTVTKKRAEADTLKALPALPKVAKKSTSGSYKVAAGDTMYAIARKHSVSYSSLAKVNPNVRPEALRVGQSLQIPGGSAIPRAIKVVEQPKKKPAPVAKAPVKKPAVAKVEEKRPALPAPLATVKIESEPTPAEPITLKDPMTLQELADKHNTSVEAINMLNSWNYRSSIKLARGSEIYLPN